MWMLGAQYRLPVCCTAGMQQKLVTGVYLFAKYYILMLIIARELLGKRKAKEHTEKSAKSSMHTQKVVVFPQ